MSAVFEFRSCLSKNQFFKRLYTENSIENYILKSILGFIGGILLTYICFIFLVFSLNFTLKRATYICAGLGVMLSLGLAFSVKIRCTVFLCIPQLFSKRGRQALLAYAFILALSGPAKNTLHNIEVMSESLACEQEELKQTENELLKYVQKPNASARKAIEMLLEKINVTVKYIRSLILQIYRNTFDILETVHHAQKWLYSISLLCNNKMGDPIQRCLNLLSKSYENCQSINPMKSEQICLIKRTICDCNLSTLCLTNDIGSLLPVSKLKKQLGLYKHRAKNIFYVKVEIHPTYPISNRSKTYHEEYQGVATEIRQKTDQFLQYFDFMSVIFSLFILVLFVNFLIVCSVIIYRHKFLTEDHFDNRFITGDFVNIDKTRAEFQMETLLPLNPREEMKYIKVMSFRLVPCEKVRLLSSFVFLIFATFKIIIHILTDSSLYWILSSVRQNERLLYMRSLQEKSPSISVHVIGDGLVASLIRNVSREVKRQSSISRFDPTPCLPDPIAPDWNRYFQILALVFICWTLALCEPYGLRLRHTVMVIYHPDRARERARWLYNKITTNRNSFVKSAIKKLQRNYKHKPQETSFVFTFLKKRLTLKCLLCELTFSGNNSYVKCASANCIGIFCNNCFASLKFCTICRDEHECDDLADFSEEKDSSEDEDLCKCNKKNSMLKKGKIGIKRHSSEVLCLNIRRLWSELDREFGKSVSKKVTNPEDFIQLDKLFSIINCCKNKVSFLRSLESEPEVESSDWNSKTFLYCKFSSNFKIVKKLQQKTKKEKKSVSFLNVPEEKHDCHKKLLSHNTYKIIKILENGLAIRRFYKIFASKTVSQKDFFHSHSLNKCKFPLSVNRTIRKTDFEKTLQNEKQNKIYLTKDSFEILRSKQNKILKNLLNEASPKKFCNEDLSIELCRTKKEKRRTVKNVTYDKATQTDFIGCLQLNSPVYECHPDLHVPSTLSSNFRIIDSEIMRQFYPSVSFATSITSEENKNQDEYPQNEFFPKNYVKKSTLKKLKSDHSFTIQSALQKPNLTSSMTRVCLKSDSSSDSFLNNHFKICMKEETTASSIESKNQFYNESYISLKSESSKTYCGLKRTAGNLNLNIECSPGFYSIETDSSNEKFLYLKPARRVRRKQKKPKTVQDNSDFIINITESSSKTKNSKTVDFLKAKLIRHCKKTLTERKSSDESRSSDIDTEECSPNTTVFFSDKEFENISRKIYSKKIQEKKVISKKSSVLSWAPDLLSDLPSSKNKPIN